MTAQQQSGVSSVREVGERDQTFTPQIVRSPLLDLRADVAQTRDQARALARDSGRLHDDVQGMDLSTRTAAYMRLEPTDVLEMLSDDFTLPWSLVARLTGVSAPAVRKWRRGGDLTVDNRTRLAGLAAFCVILHEVWPMITDVPLYLSSPVAPGLSTVTPADLLEEGKAVALLNQATNRSSAEDLLDATRPDWRDATGPDLRHRVVTASDGHPAIVPVD